MLKTTIYLTKQILRLTQFNITEESCKILKDKKIILKDNAFNPVELKAILKKEGIGSNHLVSCLFRHQLGLRFLAFPTHNKQEIASMISYEAGEILPFKPEETIIRYLILRARPDGYSDTMIMVVHKEEILKLIKKFNALSLHIQRLGLSSLAIFNCVEKLILVKGESAAKGNLMVVHFEDGIIDIIIIKDGNLEFSRGVAVDNCADFLAKVDSEIRQSMGLFFEKTKQTTLDKILISGYAINLEMVHDALKDKLNCPLEIEKKIDIAYGLAIEDENSINLFSDEIIHERKRIKFRDKIICSGLLIILNITLVGMIFLNDLNHKKSYLKELNSRLAMLKPQSKIIQTKLEKIQILKGYINSQILILNAITDLFRITPEACILNLFSINEKGVVLIQGQSDNLQDDKVLYFIRELEKSPYLKNTHLKYANRRKVENTEILDFEIQSQLNLENNTQP